MSVTLEDLANFEQFASARIRRGSNTHSLEALVREWEEQREAAATIADIKQGQKDYANGLGEPLEKVARELRSHLGIDQ